MFFYRLRLSVFRHRLTVLVMSHGILSPPVGLLSDEDVVVSPMFESTAADLRSVIRKDLLSDCSVISTSLEDKQVKELSDLGTESC